MITTPNVGSNSQPQDQDLHASPTEPATYPKNEKKYFFFLEKEQGIISITKAFQFTKGLKTGFFKSSSTLQTITKERFKNNI